MTPTERNALRDRLLRMADRERNHSPDHGTRCAVHDTRLDGVDCSECFDALAAVALANCAGSTLLDTPSGGAGAGEAVLAKLDAAHRMVSDLCRKRRDWAMSIPARPDYDPDLVIGEAIRAAEAFIMASASSAPAMRDSVRQVEENYERLHGPNPFKRDVSSAPAAPTDEQALRLRVFAASYTEDEPELYGTMGAAQKLIRLMDEKRAGASKLSDSERAAIHRQIDMRHGTPDKELRGASATAAPEYREVNPADLAEQLAAQIPDAERVNAALGRAKRVTQADLRFEVGASPADPQEHDSSELALAFRASVMTEAMALVGSPVACSRIAWRAWYAFKADYLLVRAAALRSGPIEEDSTREVLERARALLTEHHAIGAMDTASPGVICPVCAAHRGTEIFAEIEASLRSGAGSPPQEKCPTCGDGTLYFTCSNAACDYWRGPEASGALRSGAPEPSDLKDAAEMLLEFSDMAVESSDRDRLRALAKRLRSGTPEENTHTSPESAL